MVRYCRLLVLSAVLFLAACGGSGSPTAPTGNDPGNDPVDAAAIRPQLIGLASEVVAVDSAPNAEPWALTDAGTVLRRIDGLWQAVELPADRDWDAHWDAMDVLPTGDVVFYDGIRSIIAFDGTTWTVTALDSGYFGRIEDMLAVATDEIYFVQSREIWKWDGATLADVSPDDPLDTTRFTAISERDGRLAVVGPNGTFAVGSGGNFQLVDLGTTESILDVWIDPADDVWMVGGNGFLARFDLLGIDEFEIFPTPENGSFNLVTGTGRSLVYFGGHQIYRFDGVNFTPVGERSDHYGKSLWARAGNDLVMGGGLVEMLEVYDGTAWSPVWSQRAGFTGGIYGASDGTLILGDAGHLEGGVWVPHQDIAVSWRLIEGIASDDLWGVRNDRTVWHWNGATWSEVPLPSTDPYVLAIWAAASDDVHAVGGDGLALHWDGTEWTERPTPTSLGLSQVAGGPGGVFAAGTGVLLQLVDGAWVDIASPLQGDLRQLGNLGDTVFVLSREEMLIHRDGTWEPFALPAEFESAFVVGSALDDLFGVRVWRGLHHFDGETVTAIPTIAIDGRLGFESTGRGELVVTGFGGAVRYAVDALELTR